MNDNAQSEITQLCNTLQLSTIGKIDKVNIQQSGNIHIGNVININSSIEINQYIVENKVEPKSTQQLDNECYDTEDEEDFVLVSPYNILPDFRVITKSEWKARRVTSTVPLKKPVPYIIIAHTATELLSSKIDNIYHIRYIQNYHMDFKKWCDISYNFLVGGDGNVYEGRGWDNVGTHSKEFNDKSICISFIGTFCKMLPTPQQIQGAKKLIELCLAGGRVNKDFKLIGHRQALPTLSPGDCLFKEIKSWPNFSEQI